jgi:hypothetical protein
MQEGGYELIRSPPQVSPHPADVLLPGFGIVSRPRGSERALLRATTVIAREPPDLRDTMARRATMHDDHTTYRVSRSPEDGEFVATVVESGTLSWLAPDPAAALLGSRALISAKVDS